MSVKPLGNAGIEPPGLALNYAPTPHGGIQEMICKDGFPARQGICSMNAGNVKTDAEAALPKKKESLA